MKLRGGCLCGGVRYEFEGPPFDVGNCHCSMCRRFHGAAFGTYGKIDSASFRWLMGDELVATYESSPGVGWVFCRRCGSSLGMPAADGGLAEVTLGSLQDDPGVRPVKHIFVGSKAPWFEITDELPRYEAWPPTGGGS